MLNIKHSSIPTLINIKPHIEDLYTQLLILNAICLHFKKKLPGMWKCKKKQSEETKKASELVSDMTQMLELSDKHLTMINMLRALMEK